MTKNRRLLFVAGLVGAVMVLVAGVAIAQDMAFPDVDADNPHAEAIDWAAENGIVLGYGNGNFGPYDNILRGQAASMFYRYDEYRMEDVVARRGCPDCHAGPYALENEVPDGHPSVPAGATVNDCLTCHAGDGTGIAPALREIVHPVHMYSKIFAWEFMGNCFSCHTNDADGNFLLLPAAVDTDDAGIPDEIPIGTAQDIPGPPAS